MPPSQTTSAVATERRRFARPNVVEVDHGAIARNLGVLGAMVGDGVEVFAALKANAYGLGLVPVAQTLCAAGVHGIAVADPNDALSLRCDGIGVPILLYGGSVMSEDLVAVAAERDLILTVHHPTIARDIARFAARPLSVFVKLNVGLQRLGLDSADVEGAIAALQRNPKVTIGGLYTHMYVPDGRDAARAIGRQFETFTKALGAVARLGVDARYTMVASSQVLDLTNDMNLTAIDPGHLLFGFATRGPDAGVPVEPALRTIRTRLISVREVDPSDGPHPAGLGPATRIGVVPLGLRDGFPRFSAGRVLVNTQPAPLLGRPSLEHTRLDLSTAPEAQVGDDVVILGRQGEHQITVEDVMQARGYAKVVELTMAISPDIPRLATATGAPRM